MEFLGSISPAALITLAIVAIAVIVVVFAQTAAQRQHRFAVLRNLFRKTLSDAGFSYRACPTHGASCIFVVPQSTLSHTKEWQREAVDAVRDVFVRVHRTEHPKLLIYLRESLDGSLYHADIEGA